MKRFLLVLLVFVFTIHFVFAQKLNAEKYHIYRGDLKNSFLKFQNKKEGRVAFLGGSITYNTGWRDTVCAYLQNKFPETVFDFINAGIPSMGSTPGAFRFERDVLKNGRIDLLFLEAAVNDDTNNRTEKEIIRGMEGIVRHALIDNAECDVVMMYFVDPDKMENYRNGVVPEVIKLHEKVALQYNISAINLALEVTERIGANEFDWDNDFRNLHPSPFGQNIYAESIKMFLENCWGKGFDDMHISKKEIPNMLDESSFTNGFLIEPNPPKPVKGWGMVPNWKPADGKGTRFNFVDVPMLVGEFPARILKFQFKGNAAGIAVAAGSDAGIVEFSIDNSPWQKQDLFTPWSSQLHLPWYYTLVSGLKNRKHTLQIRISEEKNDNSSGRFCRIRYFYVNQ